MPPRPKIGSIIRGKGGEYRLEEEIADGNMSWALRATEMATGRKVFLKYYKSPTPTVSWYPEYLRYVDELNRQLDESAASQYCVLAQDLFTANPRPGKCSTEFFYTVYEFIDSGYDLRKLLDAPGGVDWEKRKSMAKVFLAAMKKVHEAGVVHCDLKPENVQMLPKEGTKLGLIPRMIDMDFSILAGKPAPWTSGADKQGYTGTPGYFSPEHLRAETPTTASDVFTIGIILGELLGGCHPFAEHNTDQQSYKDGVISGKYKPVVLRGDLGGRKENAQAYARLIERCFSLQASSRPSCAELHRELLALDKGSSMPVPPVPEHPVKPEAKDPVPPRSNSLTSLTLKGSEGEMTIRFPMDVGRGLLASVSKDARYASRNQFHLDRSPEGEWYVTPCAAGTTNPIALNGVILDGKHILKDGDELHLQGKSSGVKALSMIVSITPVL